MLLFLYCQLSRSSGQDVLLTNIDLAMTGMYKCEVVADKTFEKGEWSNHMLVIGG